MSAPAPLLTSVNVTSVRDLRARAAAASLAVQIAGVVSAIDVFHAVGVLRGEKAWGLLWAILVAAPAWWGARYCGRRLRTGCRWAAFLAAAWTVLLAVSGLVVLGVIYRGAERVGVLGWILAAAWIVPVVLVARFLDTRSAFRRHAARAVRHRVSMRLMDHPWETPSPQRQAFGSRRRVWPWVYLAAVPLVALFLGSVLLPGLSGFFYGSEHDLAYEMGGLVAAIPFALFGALIMGRLYRRARRSAVLFAVQLQARRPEPPVLYLRSFRDDNLRVRARRRMGAHSSNV